MKKPLAGEKIQDFRNKRKKKQLRFFQNAATQLVIWFTGLLFGSLRRISIEFQRFQKWWSILLILLLLFVSERISFSFYNKKSRTRYENTNSYHWIEIAFPIQARKIGRLFAVFLDAFKVGS